MKCPKCGHDMGSKAKCLRCGFVYKGIVAIDPEKIETEEEPKSSRRVVDPDEVRVSRAGGGGIFGDIFGGGLFGGLFDSLFGGSIFADIFGVDDTPDGYEYDPKYYDAFGNEIYIPDEFERESVTIENAELLVESPKHEEPPKTSSHDPTKKPHEHHEGQKANERSKPQDHAQSKKKKSGLRDKLDGVRRKRRTKH